MHRLMLLVFGIVWGTTCAAIGAAAEKSAGPIEPYVTDGSLNGYKLVWHDEFDGDKLNADQWVCRTGIRYWSVSEPENVSVTDGMLRIALKKERADGKDYTAGGVISKRAFNYGYYECRFKVPSGKGWHTSFWMTNNNRRKDDPTAAQEIDVCENDSIHPTSYSANLHQWKPVHKGFGAIKVTTPDLSADFHVWGCEFTARNVVFYFDGRQVGKRDVAKLKLSEQNIWLTSIASPLGKTDKVDDSKLPAYALFDWVRFYQR